MAIDYQGFAPGRRILCTVVILALCFHIPIRSSGDSADAVAWGAISHYSSAWQVGTNASDVPGGHWSRYLDSVCDDGHVVPFNTTGGGVTEFYPLDIQMPFFSAGRVSVFVSPYGFLSTTSRAMCSSFCANPSDAFGFGSYVPTSTNGGGDWPIIALFATPLSLVDFPDSRICYSPLRVVDPAATLGGPDGVQAQTVEYDNVYLQGAAMSTRDPRPLKAQVTLFSNGTIVMRYMQYPDRPLLMSWALIPLYASIALSSSESAILRLSDAGDLPAALRFEPALDECFSWASSRDECLAHTVCAWCTTTSQCLSKTRSNVLCPTLQSKTVPAEEANMSSADGSLWTATVASALTAATGPSYDNLPTQQFYSVTVSQGSMFAAAPEGANIFSGTDLGASVVVDLPFHFPFFTRRPPGGEYSDFASHASTPDAIAGNTTIELHNPGYVSLSGAARYSCAHWLNMCPEGDYIQAIVPFSTAASWDAETASVTVFHLSERARGDILCVHGHCPPATVIQVRGVRPFDSAAEEGAVYAGGQVYSYQLYLDANGEVAIVYDRTVEAPWQFGPAGYRDVSFVSFPNAVVGLMKHGVSDPTSILVPSRLVQQGAELRFSLSSSCMDCGALGRCHEETGRCICIPGYSGESGCTVCAENYYGPTCEPCPPCANGGTCSWGEGGMGICHCATGFAGVTCESECPPARSTARGCPHDFQCGYGGTCACGACVCLPGWTGSQCTVPLDDPCMAYTMDGCTTCVTKPGCQFCPDTRLCVSAEWPRFNADRSCHSTLVTFFDAQRCYPSPTSGPGDNSRLMLTFGALLGALLLLVLMGCMLCCLYVVAPRPVDRRRLTEVPGAPNYRPPRRERHVMSFRSFDPDADTRGAYTYALPLKQISLRTLYRRQRHRDNDSE